MAYKKYIKKNGKVYGPYLYHSKRVGDKVVSEYVGSKNSSKLNFNKKYLFFIVAFFLIILLIWILNSISFSGKAISHVFEKESEKASLDSLNPSVDLNLEAFNEKSSDGVFEQSVRAYKDWIIVHFKKGDYEIEYSYNNKLSNEELNSLVEKDKEIWLEKVSNFN